MKQITISNGTTTITMPITFTVSDAGAPEYKEITMAGGKKVREMIGFRPGFKYEWDYVPADMITALIAMLRTGAFFTVGYFDLDGADKTGTFSVSYPSFELFTFESDGTGVWHKCSLTITAQEVV